MCRHMEELMSVIFNREKAENGKMVLMLKISKL